MTTVSFEKITRCYPGADRPAVDALRLDILAGPRTGADVVARVDPRTPPRKGERITLRLRPDSTYFFSASTGERLPHA
ncbi:hypothetical protein [Streptomyces lydicus]|uniref:hypothetical protein n=1 Tax=Streptomyces lydicus TaxID=47763 RepID=UPI0037AB1F83